MTVRFCWSGEGSKEVEFYHHDTSVVEAIDGGEWVVPLLLWWRPVVHLQDPPCYLPLPPVHALYLLPSIFGRKFPCIIHASKLLAMTAHVHHFALWVTMKVFTLFLQRKLDR